MTHQSKIDALQRLAAPDSGATPSEREVAKTKLRELLAKGQSNTGPDQQAYGRSLLIGWARADQIIQDIVMSAFMDGHAMRLFEEETSHWMGTAVKDEKRPTDDPPIQD